MSVIYTHFITIFPGKIYCERRLHRMKKYMAPEMEALTFGAEDAIAGILPSNVFNDGEFGGW